MSAQEITNSSKLLISSLAEGFVQHVSVAGMATKSPLLMKITNKQTDTIDFSPLLRISGDKDRYFN